MNKARRRKRIKLAHQVQAQQQELQERGAGSAALPMRPDGMFIKKVPVRKDRVRTIFVHPSDLLA